MKILITGGAGYLGSVITGKLLNADHEVTVLDKLIFNQVSLLSHTSNPKFKFIHGDVRNEVLLEKLCNESDVIIPLAAIVGFPACDAEPELAKQINFQQIFNIVKFTKNNGSIIMKVNARQLAAPNEYHIEFTITDTGIGIPEHKLKSVFEKFTQVQSKYEDTVNTGTGLGLSIAKNAVLNHGGDLILEDSPLGGLRIRLLLPLSHSFSFSFLGLIFFGR